MNLLYISNLNGKLWAGPNNSVPAQINAQAEFDNVLWYNINYQSLEMWKESGLFYNLENFPSKSIEELPAPFSRPDLVIFQGTYEYPFSKIGYEIQKKQIPYILIPRSQLTEKAQKNKKFKKMIGNTLYFNRFISNAIAIQYLTHEEYLESGSEWNKNHIVIPNGVVKKEFESKEINLDQLKGIYIGRVDIYQKGLDMLIEASKEIREELLINNCTIDIYGPDFDDSKSKLIQLISKYRLENIISIHDGVFGEEKEEIQRNADFFVMTSRFEGHPMGLIEALSYGLPSVVTSGTNMAGEVYKFNAGWTTESKVESIKNGLLKLLEEKNTLQTKAKNAIKLSEEYDWKELANISHEKYISLLKGEISDKKNK